MLMDQPRTKPTISTDVPAPRRRLGDQLGKAGSTDEDLPSLGMAVIDATHRTKGIAEVSRSRSEEAVKRSSAIDDFERELNDIDAAWSERRARLSLRR